jgi:hypothetical protein
MLRARPRAWDERRRHEERQAIRRGSKATRPSRDIMRRASRAAGRLFQRKTG